MTETELANRLEKLERDNRRLKRLGAAALVLAAALGAIYATRPVPEKITAREFDVVDDAGRVRIRLSTTPGETSVRVLDAQGHSAASMEERPGSSWVMAGNFGGNAAMLDSSATFGSEVSVSYSPWHVVSAGKSGKALRDAVSSYLTRVVSAPSVSMSVSPSGVSSVGLYDSEGKGLTEMDVLPSGEPSITLRDAQGFRTDLGSTSTLIPATGQTQHTSAASIVMYGNDEKHHVIWKAP